MTLSHTVHYVWQAPPMALDTVLEFSYLLSWDTLYDERPGLSLFRRHSLYAVHTLTHLRFSWL
jgi:hypothetical protein